MSDIYPVDPGFAAQARITREAYANDYDASVNDAETFWLGLSKRLDWFKAPTRAKDVSYDLKDFHIRWFEDGELNASVNCLDRHLDTHGDKVALIFEPDSPDTPAQRITYRELHARVCKLANALRSLGVAEAALEAAGPEALVWALERGSRSGRVAFQFAKDYAGRQSA